MRERPDPPRPVVEDAPDPADLALLEQQVAAAASAAAGVAEEREFAVLARDEVGRLVAGISAIAWAGHCTLQAMWVDEALRGRGLAGDLMVAAEEEARRRDCTLVTFHAYDLLATGLYARLGYRTVAVLEGSPPGSATRWYWKPLRSDANDGAPRPAKVATAR